MAFWAVWAIIYLFWGAQVRATANIRAHRLYRVYIAICVCVYIYIHRFGGFGAIVNRGLIQAPLTVDVGVPLVVQYRLLCSP